MCTPAAATFEHDALLYRDEGEFLAGTREFIEQGLDRGEPVLVAVPGEKIPRLRWSLNGHRSRVSFVNMRQLGRNPGRIIPFVRGWVDDRHAPRVRFVGEPIWPGRTPAETLEAMRHEGLINLAFADTGASILCPYDANGLDSAVLADAERTHPTMIACGERRQSYDYTDPEVVFAAEGRALPAPSSETSALTVTPDLSISRRFVERHPATAGLSRARMTDLLLAVNEATTNALIHGERPALLRVWRDGDEIVCEIADCGRFVDPLAGRRRPSSEGAGGRGLWMMNQLCDLVELRPGRRGTTVRLHMAVS